MTIKTLEQFDAEYAKKRKELEFEIELASTFPVTISYCSNIYPDGSKCKAWVSLEAETLKDAFDIALELQDRFVLRNVAAFKHGCVSILPAGWHDDQYVNNGQHLWTIPHAVEVLQTGGKGFYSFEVSFYLEDPAVRVIIRVKNAPGRLRAYKSARYDRDGEPVEVKFSPAPYIGQANIDFGGGSRDSFNTQAYFNGVNAAFKTLFDASGQEYPL